MRWWKRIHLAFFSFDWRSRSPPVERRSLGFQLRLIYTWVRVSFSQTRFSLDTLHASWTHIKKSQPAYDQNYCPNFTGNRCMWHTYTPTVLQQPHYMPTTYHFICGTILNDPTWPIGLLRTGQKWALWFSPNSQCIKQCFGIQMSIWGQYNNSYANRKRRILREQSSNKIQGPRHWATHTVTGTRVVPMW